MDYVQLDNNIIAPEEQDDQTIVRWVRKGNGLVALECICKVGEITTYKEVPLVPKPKYGMIDIPMDQVQFPSLLR